MGREPAGEAVFDPALDPAGEAALDPAGEAALDPAGEAALGVGGFSAWTDGGREVLGVPALDAGLEVWGEAGFCGAVSPGFVFGYMATTSSPSL